MQALTIGKIRGLQATSTSQGVFSVLAFDHRQSFARMLPVIDGREASYEDVVAAKCAVVEALAPYSSAVLLDPVYGAAQTIANGALPRETGLIVAVEETGYTGLDYARLTEVLPGWNIAKIKRMGADAVKLLIYYHPDAGDLTSKQEALTAQIIEECREADIVLFLEAICYSVEPSMSKDSAAFAEQRPALITRIAQRLSTLEPDVLKIEFPVDARHDADMRRWIRACEAVSASVACPWTVLSAAVDFDLFARQVQVACESGASGFIGGRAIWKEGIPMPQAKRDTWLCEVAASRMDALSEIAAKHARPWTDLAPLQDRIPENWHQAYTA
jgi:tagatose 1,6-diphosphate aldolase